MPITFFNKTKLLTVKLRNSITLAILIFASVQLSKAVVHPSLSLTPDGVKEIKASLGKYPAFDQSFAELKAIADAALNEEIIIPIPVDGGGGYTHEKHKSNYYAMNAAGILYQLTGNVKYAQFVRDMLVKYAAIYPSLPLHPAVQSESPGKLFWQTLNEAVWLVHTANAYDCVYDFISVKDKNYIEKNLFHPMAEFLSNGNPANYATFNRMHNHGTWSEAAVGMIGYVMNDKDLIDKSLYGSKKDGKTGFIKQLDMLFSPDGYFTEGPYYQRYSIWPFMTFAQAIQNNQPDLKIFNYRNSILLKAVNTLLQSTYNYEVFMFNDALSKTIQTQEIVYAVDIAYKNDPSNKPLLDIARLQESFIVSDAGLATVKALNAEKIEPFRVHSIYLRDGANGDEGGIAVFRNGKANKESCLTFKATSHGLSHGHYDKLSICLFDNGHPILTDYGAARFLNIEPKSGGGYTKENHTWAMQSIAHNTVTLDEISHFEGKIKVSSKFHSDINYCDISKLDLQVVSGTEKNAYPGTTMQRTSALVKVKSFEYPIVIDLFRVTSSTNHIIDLPFYYKGQLISTSFKFNRNSSEMKALGTDNGYQHLWVEATAKSELPNSCFTWKTDNRFYSITTLTDSNSELMLNRVGAGDPNFNLRDETSFMIRQTNRSNHTFASVIEPHGLYDLNREITVGFESNVAKIELLQDNVEYSALSVVAKDGKTYLFVAVNSNFDSAKKRTITVQNHTISFVGNYYFAIYKN
ncbi:MAG: alginate lyase family protein [Bacteroidales bacterium]|nr:alginate lyase family protein [Bacteroidales bacterium]